MSSPPPTPPSLSTTLSPPFTNAAPHLPQDTSAISHNGHALTVKAARRQLRTGTARLTALEADACKRSGEMQTLLRRQNVVHASYRRTGRLIYVCEMNHLGRAFEMQCVALRSIEERCLGLERELSALTAKLRRAKGRRERANSSNSGSMNGSEEGVTEQQGTTTHDTAAGDFLLDIDTEDEDEDCEEDNSDEDEYDVSFYEGLSTSV